MPRQNRVTPFGEIVATPERGTFMGNRGLLHDTQGRIRRTWRLERWLICLLEFRGRRRTVMTPGQYTELFFLDEATALAAGHRPCAECLRDRFNAFSKAWAEGNPGSTGRITATAVDRQLHLEHLAPDDTKRCFEADLVSLPDGVFVQNGVWGESAWLVQGSWLLAWSPGGYTKRKRRPKRERVSVLTPRSSVETIRQGTSLWSTTRQIRCDQIDGRQQARPVSVPRSS
jgi:hypothetical protein